MGAGLRHFPVLCIWRKGVHHWLGQSARSGLSARGEVLGAATVAACCWYVGVFLLTPQSAIAMRPLSGRASNLLQQMGLSCGGRGTCRGRAWRSFTPDESSDQGA